METAISTTSFIHYRGVYARWLAYSSFPQSFIHSSCYAMPPSSYSHACNFLSHEKTDRLMRAFPGYLLQPCVTFSTVPSSEVCTFNLRKTQNKQQPGQFFSSSFCFFPAKFLIFCFSLLFPTYLLGLWSIVVISPGLTTRCCSGRSVLAKVWFDDGEVLSQSVTNE